MIEHLAKLPLDRAEDVFALRQGGRVAAAFVGCDEADQVRFATALSELGREALVHGAGASAAFALDDDGSLRVDIERFPRSSGPAAKIVGLEAARKLIDDVSVTNDTDTATVSVTIGRRVPSEISLSAEKLRSELRRNVALRPLDELRLENRDLVATLSELRAQQEQLMHLNAELEETNRGVMAMYAQLADELEETNRGVVALYAELDDKTVRLNEASEAKTRFLASVSHELRSPVNSILALVRLLTEPDGDALSDDQHKQLALVRSSGSELLRLVNGLLDLAKAESGRLDPEVAPVDLAIHFAELRGSLRPLARPGVKLDVDIPDISMLETDAVLLGQVLRNLLTNALKFTAQGSVRLAARSSAPHEIEISVTDTGVGIAAADQAKVFEEFYQVRGPLQADHKGTGLGLPYARRVTQTLGGEMSLESEPGRGSTFTIRLPTRWQPLLRAPESPGPAPPTAPVNVERILIIDDDEGFRTALRGMLQGTAAHIAEATGGIEGLAMMREHAPDLAFVDLWMPDLDGANVLSSMSADDDLRSIPVVIVTSAQLTETVRTSLGHAVTVLSKANVTRAIVHDVIMDALRIAPTTA